MLQKILYNRGFRQCINYPHSPEVIYRRPLIKDRKGNPCLCLDIFTGENEAQSRVSSTLRFSLFSIVLNLRVGIIASIPAFIQPAVLSAAIFRTEHEVIKLLGHYYWTVLNPPMLDGIPMELRIAKRKRNESNRSRGTNPADYYYVGYDSEFGKVHKVDAMKHQLNFNKKDYIFMVSPRREESVSIKISPRPLSFSEQDQALVFDHDADTDTTRVRLVRVMDVDSESGTVKVVIDDDDSVENFDLEDDTTYVSLSVEDLFPVEAELWQLIYPSESAQQLSARSEIMELTKSGTLVPFVHDSLGNPDYIGMLQNYLRNTAPQAPQTPQAPQAPSQAAPQEPTTDDQDDGNSAAVIDMVIADTEPEPEAEPEEEVTLEPEDQGLTELEIKVLGMFKKTLNNTYEIFIHKNEMNSRKAHLEALVALHDRNYVVQLKDGNYKFRLTPDGISAKAKAEAAG